MPSKTNKSMTKRFHVTKRGKLLHRQAHQSHFRSKKTSKNIRNLRPKKSLAKSDVKNVLEYLPFN